MLARFIPLTGNRQDDHFLGHFSTYLPHHFFPVVPTDSNEDKRGMGDGDAIHIYKRIYTYPTCAPKYIYLLAEVKWRGAGFMEMNGEVLHLRRRKVFPGIWSYRDIERDIQVLAEMEGRRVA